MRKYQRNLVPYFKKFQLPELEGDKKRRIFDRLGEKAQSLLEDHEEVEIQKSKKLALIETVKDRFDTEQNLQDLAILYEVTGFQGEIPEDKEEDFWANYANFKDHNSKFDSMVDGIN